MDEPADSPMIVRAIEADGFVRTNRAFFAKVGIPSEELAAKPFVDWIVPEDQGALERVLSGAEPNCQVRHLARDGAPLLLHVQGQVHSDGTFAIGSCAAAVAGRGSDESIGKEVTVKSTLHRIAQIVEEQNPGHKCSILLVSHGRFVKGAGPSLPDEYNNAIDGFAIGPTVGSCGTAIYWGLPVIVEDIQADPLWAPFAELAKAAGVSACWSHPFVNNAGRVLGALALYSVEPCAPTAEQLSRLRAAAQMTGLAVERGRAEEELRSANDVKSRFMANMSHEIRTPLNALIGISSVLEGSQEAPQREEIEMLRESGEQLLDLFTGVLELTEAQDRRVQGAEFNLVACARSVQSWAESNVKGKDVQVSCAIADDVPEWATIDGWAFERVVSLLMHNGVKFTSTGSVELALAMGESGLQVSVTDTGCGIDVDRIAELREPFVQGDLSTTKEYSGFGLGLSLSDLCVEALGGALEFAPNEPEGTVARFTIPIGGAVSGEGLAEAPIKVDPSSADLPILVVEDNPLNRRVFQRILERADYEVHFSMNGAEALEAMEKNEYSCVVMDCQMPVMDGYEATRRIRAKEESTGGHTPIIAVTANALAEDREICLSAGMDEYLKKPVRGQELIGTLETFLGQD